MCYQKDWLKGYEEIAPKRIYIGNNTIMETISMGNVEISMSMRDEIIDVIFKVFVFASKIVLNIFLIRVLCLEIFSNLVKFFVLLKMISKEY